MNSATTGRPRLGRIEKVNLREAWPHEANDFTTWLAKNLSVLGDALDMELELLDQEAPVEKFSLDLLARESGTNRTVVIENQLEPTNHDHLGKLLTYAGGYDANVLVWIAKNFKDAHRQALDWLNQCTDENTEFFGIVVELLKIEDSPPAPNLKLVATPNEWRKESAKDLRDRKLSDRQLRYMEFFQQLIDALREQGFTKARKPGDGGSYYFASGYKSVRYRAVFHARGLVRVDVCIIDSSTDWNKSLFDKLEGRIKSIESELGGSLEWERLDDKKESRIAVLRTGSIDDDPEPLEELQKWMLDTLLKFKRVFDPHLDKLVK